MDKEIPESEGLQYFVSQDHERLMRMRRNRYSDWTADDRAFFAVNSIKLAIANIVVFILFVPIGLPFGVLAILFGALVIPFSRAIGSTSKSLTYLLSVKSVAQQIEEGQLDE